MARKSWANCQSDSSRRLGWGGSLWGHLKIRRLRFNHDFSLLLVGYGLKFNTCAIHVWPTNPCVPDLHLTPWYLAAQGVDPGWLCARSGSLEDVGCQWLCRAKGLWLDWSSCCMPEWWRMQVETVETWDLATLGRDVRWFPSTSPKRWKTRSASPWFTDTATHVATKNRGGSCNALVYICSNKIQQTSMLHRASCTESQSLTERLH